MGLVAIINNGRGATGPQGPAGEGATPEALTFSQALNFNKYEQYFAPVVQSAVYNFTLAGSSFGTNATINGSINANGDAWNFSSDFIVMRNDYSNLDEGYYDVIFMLGSDGKVRVIVAATESEAPDVPDTTAPVITLIGSSTINVETDGTYTEQGATATDNIDGDITADIVVTGTVNTAVEGTYTKYYNVQDAAGNNAPQVTRSVVVSDAADTTIPVITLIGASTINLTEGDTYTELGATATDDTDGDITGDIVITGTVDTDTPATYTKYYNVQDAAGNNAVEVTRSVVVSAAFESILLLSGVKLTQSGSNLVADSSGDVSGWKSYGRMNAYIPSSTDGAMRVTILDATKGVLLGLKKTSTVGIYTSYNYFAFANGDGTDYYAGHLPLSVEHTSVATTPANGDVLEIGRLGGNIVIRHSTDGVNFNTIHDFGADSSLLYLFVSLSQNSAQLVNLRSVGTL